MTLNIYFRTIKLNKKDIVLDFIEFLLPQVYRSNHRPEKKKYLQVIMSIIEIKHLKKKGVRQIFR